MKANRFRFRVWNKISKEMTYFGNAMFDWTDKCKTFIVKMEIEGNVKQMLVGYGDIMQSTGLCDKNGREIFEGDLIRQEDDGGSEVPLEVWKVEWLSYCAGFSPFCTWGSDVGAPLSLTAKAAGVQFSNYAFHRECEIIGNICENPELIPPLKGNMSNGKGCDPAVDAGDAGNVGRARPITKQKRLQEKMFPDQ